MSPRPPLRTLWLGRRRYVPMHDLMRAVADARKRGEGADVLLLLEHDPVVTLGRGADGANVLLTEQALAARGVDLAATGRGGDVTYHGPGQLVGYPILDLKPERCDVRRYVRSLAEAMIQIAREHEVEAGVVDGMIGVWADRQAPTEWAGAPWARHLAKLGAIGVRLSRWVTTHGFALNVSVDLRDFGVIVPCGIRDHGVTSIADLTGRVRTVREVALAARRPLARGLDLEIAPIEDREGMRDEDLLAMLIARATSTS